MKKTLVLLAVVFLLSSCARKPDVPQVTTEIAPAEEVKLSSYEKVKALQVGEEVLAGGLTFLKTSGGYLISNWSRGGLVFVEGGNW